MSVLAGPTFRSPCSSSVGFTPQLFGLTVVQTRINSRSKSIFGSASPPRQARHSLSQPGPAQLPGPENAAHPRGRNCDRDSGGGAPFHSYGVSLCPLVLNPRAGHLVAAAGVRPFGGHRVAVLAEFTPAEHRRAFLAH